MVKKITFGIIALIVIIGSIAMYNWIKHSSFSGIVSAVSYKTVPTKKYAIETPGINPRVYEWDTADGMHCLTIMRDSTDTAPALQCWPKQKTLKVEK